jgi:hypothetical protein
MTSAERGNEAKLAQFHQKPRVQPEPGADLPNEANFTRSHAPRGNEWKINHNMRYGRSFCLPSPPGRGVGGEGRRTTSEAQIQANSGTHWSCHAPHPGPLPEETAEKVPILDVSPYFSVEPLT